MGCSLVPLALLRTLQPFEPRTAKCRALLAATVVKLPFGTLYAFIVFLKPMEALLGATRAEMSFELRLVQEHGRRVLPAPVARFDYARPRWLLTSPDKPPLSIPR